MSVTNIADPGQLNRDADAALERIAAVRAEIGGVIFGQEIVVDLQPGGRFSRADTDC